MFSRKNSSARVYSKQKILFDYDAAGFQHLKIFELVYAWTGFLRFVRAFSFTERSQRDISYDDASGVIKKSSDRDYFIQVGMRRKIASGVVCDIHKDGRFAILSGMPRPSLSLPYQREALAKDHEISRPLAGQ